MSIDELRRKRALLKKNTEITLNNMQKIADKSYRVAEVASNAANILDDLDKKFEEKTDLQRHDIKFLFVAICLQLARIYILNELTNKENAGSGNKNESKLHSLQKEILKKFNSNGDVKDEPYYASLEHIITKAGVPYDATTPLTEDEITKILKKGNFWDYDISSMITLEKLNLFKGANHRFSTLGHDPILGLVFGTANIMTNTITCVKEAIIGKDIGIPTITTNHVVYTSAYTHPRIATYGSTTLMLKHAFERAKESPSVFVASFIKQIIHIGTDLYTTKGIHIPGANLILTNSTVERITQHIGAGELIKIGTSAKIAEFINLLISTFHVLLYNPVTCGSLDIYSIRTKKIILYSNLIATGSNVIWVAANAQSGNVSEIKKLDWGGLLVTIHRLLTDTEFIRQVKDEFVFGGFNKMIQGNDLELEEVTLWE